MRLRRLGLLGVLALTLLSLLWVGLATPTRGAPPPPRAFVHPQVWKDLAREGRATFIVYLREQPDVVALQRRLAGRSRLERRLTTVRTLQQVADRTQRGLLRFLQKADVRTHVFQVRRLWIVNALIVEGDAKALTLLRDHPDVGRILPNREHRLPADALRRPPTTPRGWHLWLTAAQRVHDELGITGRGVVVANLDTGVEWTVPALRATYRGADGNHNYNWFDFTGAFPEEPGDDHGHGTFTMALLAAASETPVGVAPGARWIAVKVFDANGRTTDAWLHQAFQWILAPTDLQGRNPDPTRAPDIVSNSWGTFNGGDETFLPDVLAWRAAGIIPVFAAGNDGDKGEGTVNSPGAFAPVIAVGATDASDRVADFSSRGPAPSGRLKPDVSAPGVDVLSLTNDGDLATGSGTSFSTPIVAGVLALMREANPTLDFAGLYHLLTRTAVDLGDPGPDWLYGWGRVNAYAAVQAARQASALTGTITDTDGRPIARATLTGTSVTDPDLTFTAQTDAAGRYRLVAPAGTYTVHVRAFGYAPATVGPLALPAGLDVLQDVRLTPQDRFPLALVVRDPTGPVTDAVVSLAGTPVVVTGTTTADGAYTLYAPRGTYTLTVRTDRHRTARVPVHVPATAPLTVTLMPAPRLLVVNGDAWAGDDVRFYYRRLLDTAGFPFTWWDVKDAASVPTAADLAPFDVVLWSHPLGSPGWYRAELNADAWPALRAYVNRGGRLLMTGPEIGYWEVEQNIGNTGAAPLVDLFGVTYVEDASDARYVDGLPDEIAAGISLELNHLLAYKNQQETDVIRPAPAAPTARLIQAYRTSPPKGAGVRYLRPQGRTVYLGYGLEGTDPAGGARLLERLLNWLSEPAPLLTTLADAIAPGERLPVTLTVYNPTSIAWPDVQTHLAADPALVALGPTTWTFDLPPRGRRTLTTTLVLREPRHGNTPLPLIATLRLVDGRTLTQTRTVTVHAADLRPSTGLLPPDLLPGRLYTGTFALVNAGPVSATTAFTAHIPAAVTITPTVPTATLSADGRLLTWAGTVPAFRPGRPTYLVRTSEDPDGPAFAWEAPARTLALDMGDDTVRGPLPLGFAFPFFGRTYEEMWVSSNGWIALVEPARAFPFNRQLPDTGAPAALIAPFWDDLNPRNGGTVWWHSDGRRVVVTWEGVPRYGDGGPYTFQAILAQDGTITFQYLSMGEPTDQATVGLQNEEKDQGVLLAYNEPFVKDTFAVRFLPPQPHIPGRVDIPVAVQAAPGVPDNTPVVVTMTVRAASVPAVTRPITLVVTPADFSATVLDVPDRWPVGQQAVATLTVRNTGVGQGTAHVTLTAAPGLQFQVAGRRTTTWRWTGTLQPGTSVSLPVTVTVAPDVPAFRPLTVTLVLTDAAHAPLVQAYSAVTARPRITARWDVAPENAVQGQVITSTVYLWNTGNLTATLNVTQTLPPGLLPITQALPAGMTYDPTARVLRWSGALAAAEADYTWEDNRAAALPFDWLAPREAITVLHNVDDVTRGPFALGFAFPFYETLQDQVFINSNGWLSFSAGDRRDFANRALPTPAAPGNLLAVWWDDLRVPLTGTVRFWSDRQRAVVTWDNVLKFGKPSPYTFQVQLDASGVITYLYRDMSPPLDSATIGLQDAEGRRGVTVAHNDPAYMVNGRVVRFRPPFDLVVLRYPLRVSGAGPRLTMTLHVAAPVTAPVVFTRTVWVNVADLSRSSAQVSPEALAFGDAVTVTLTLRNTGFYTGLARPTLYVPEALAIVATDGDAREGQVHWERAVGPGQIETAYAVLTLARRLPDGTRLPLQVEDPAGWSAALTLTVQAEDLSASRLEARPAEARPARPLTLTLTLINLGHAATPVTWTLPVPEGVDVLALGASAGPAPRYDPAHRTVAWSGPMPARSQRRFTIRVGAGGVLRWRPEARLRTPSATHRIRGPEVRWGWVYRLPRLMRR